MTTTERLFNKNDVKKQGLSARKFVESLLKCATIFEAPHSLMSWIRL